MDSYVDFGNSIGVDMSVGFLYTRIDVTKHRHVDKLSPAYVNARFRFYLARAGMENCNQRDLSCLSTRYELEVPLRNYLKDNP